MKTGDQVAFGYSYLVRADFKGDHIALLFTTDKVIIRGRNLAPLFDALIKQSTAYVAEIDELHAETETGIPKDACVVIEIRFEAA